MEMIKDIQLVEPIYDGLTQLSCQLEFERLPIASVREVSVLNGVFECLMFMKMMKSTWQLMKIF